MSKGISSNYDPSVIEAIEKAYAKAQGQTELALDVAPEPEPAIVAEVVEPPKLKPKRNKQVKGRMFSGVFGWKPTHIQDIEVPKFKPEDWDENARCMIPAINPHWVWPKKETEYLLRSMIAGDTTLIWGAQGTGKSCLQEQVCALLNIPFWRMSCNKETREQHFTGSAGVSWNDAGQMQITQEPTLLTDSLQYGGVFCEDEAFRHNSALVLQSLREASNRTLILPDAPGRTAEERVLKAPKGRWWYTMTDNTAGIGDETGQFDAEVQDASTLDRIDTTIELGYLTRAQEVKVLKSIAGDDVPVDKLKDMVEVAHLVREGFKSGTMNATLSTRALINWVKKAAVYGEVTTSFRLAWYNKLSRDDQMVASEAFTQATGEYL